MSEELVDTVAHLWPGSEVVSTHHAPDGRPIRARYAVIRRGGAPNMLVPCDPSRAAAESIRRISAASTLRDHAARTAAGAVIRRVPGVLREQVEVRGGHDGLAGHLGELLGTEVSFSVSIGSARVNRKPILQLFDPAGRCLAFAKVGWSPHTDQDVLAEGEALRTLSGCHFRRLVFPSVLARSTWQVHPVLVLEPLRAPTLVPRRRRSTPPSAAMDELARQGDPDHELRDGGVLADAHWWRRQWASVGRLGDPVARTRIGVAMDRIETRFGHQAMGWGAWHGDWTPWNMAAGRFGGVLVWDWERFETGVPLGMDVLHYVTHARHPGGAPSTAELLRSLEIAATWPASGAAPAYVRKLLYLVAVSCRYLPLVEVPGGEHIAGRAARSLLALEQLLRT